MTSYPVLGLVDHRSQCSSYSNDGFRQAERSEGFSIQDFRNFGRLEALEHARCAAGHIATADLQAIPCKAHGGRVAFSSS
jgi:hypothetical protein